MRAGLLVAAVTTIALPCAAQTSIRPGPTRPPTERERIITLLQSADAREQAWGAWYAGQSHQREFVRSLQDIVRMHAAAISQAETAARDVALDALIQMGAAVSPDLLPLIYEQQRPAEALILASHVRETATDFLTDLLRTKDAEAWFAAANLLLESRPRGYAAILLHGVRIQITVSITDDGRSGFGAGSGGSGGIGCGVAGNSPGLPPWPSYSLTSYARPGVVVLALGPHAIYYERRVMPAGQGRNGSGASVSGPSSQQRLDYIAALLSIDPLRLPVREFESHAVVWRGDTALQQDLARIHTDVAGRLQMLAGQLQSLELLTADEVRALPPDIIQLRVDDQRTRRD